MVSKDISTAIASKAAKPPDVNARNSGVFATADVTIAPVVKTNKLCCLVFFVNV